MVEANNRAVLLSEHNLFPPCMTNENNSSFFIFLGSFLHLRSSLASGPRLLFQPKGLLFSLIFMPIF